MDNIKYNMGQKVVFLDQEPGGQIVLYFGKIVKITFEENGHITYTVRSWMREFFREAPVKEDKIFLTKESALNYIKDNIESFVKCKGDVI